MLIKSPIIRSLFGSARGRNGALPAGEGEVWGAAPAGDANLVPASPRAGALRRLECELHEQLQSLLDLEAELGAGRLTIASLEDVIASREADLTGVRAALADAERARDTTRDELAKALSELEEFVRVAVLLLHGDCVLGPRHRRSLN